MIFNTAKALDLFFELYKYHILLIIFLCYAFLMFCWARRAPNGLIEKFLRTKYILRTMWFFGCWHNWGMFTNPYSYNTNTYATITYSDNTTEDVTIYDGFEGVFVDMPIAKQYHIFEKFMENCFAETAGGEFKVRKSFGIFIKKRYEKSTNKKIKQIDFIDHSSHTPDWITGKTPADTYKKQKVYPFSDKVENIGAQK